MYIYKYICIFTYNLSTAVVEALITHEAPIQTPWTVTKYITSAHEEVVWHEGKLPRMQKRVTELVSR